MSWSRLGFLLVLMLSGALAGCGYTPLYGTSSAGGQTAEALTHVVIGPIDQGLVGLDVRTGLLDRISPDGTPDKAQHRLEVRLVPSLNGLLVQPDSAITRSQSAAVSSFQPPITSPVAGFSLQTVPFSTPGLAPGFGAMKRASPETPRVFSSSVAVGINRWYADAGPALRRATRWPRP